MSILSMVALRMVTQKGAHECLKIYEELKKSGGRDGEKPESSPSGSSRSARRRIRRRKLKESKRSEEEITARRRESVVDVGPYNLVTHADRRAGKDFLERSLMTVFLLKCLQRVGFFVRPTPDDGTLIRISAETLYLTFR